MTLGRVWENFWFREASPIDLIACRALVSLNALWIVMSRPDLPEVLVWPRAFWSSVGDPVRARFLLVSMPKAVETSLYLILIAALAAAACGFFPRVSCALAALLLYRFAPLELIFSTKSGPHFRGLTIPAVVLVLLACAEIPRGRDRVSREYGWPLMLARVLVANIYLSSGIAKLINVGPRWFSAGYFQTLVNSMALPEFTAPWAHAWANEPALGWIGAFGGFVLDFAILLPLFRPRTSWVVVPLLLVGHCFIWKVFGVIFLSVPLLLIFLPWSDIVKFAAQRFRGVARSGPAIA
jgi:hypothetical protein